MVKRVGISLVDCPVESSPLPGLRQGVFLVVVLGFCLLATGCRREGPERVVVSGNVTYQGKPLEEAQIRFVPAAGSEMPTTGAFVVDGRYTADSKGGVPVGEHRVIIEAYRFIDSGGIAAAVPRNPETTPPRKQFLPAKYNAQTELRINIESGSGKIIQDYELSD